MMPFLSQKGIALVLVLWVIVLLTVIAGAMSMTQRNGVYMTSNIRAEREGRALVDAGINFMMLQLKVKPGNEQNALWPMDGKLRPWEFAGRTIWIGALPESGRIDLNRAPEELLLGLLVSAGLSESQAASIKDAIVDWRDRDQDPKPQGAEDSDYISAGRPLGARDELFMSVEELQQVLGVTPDLYNKIKPALTVHSRQRKVNPFYAPPEVLKALPGMTEEMVNEFSNMRTQPGAEAALQGAAPSGQFVTKSKGIAFRVMAEVELPDGTVVQGEAIVNSRRKTPHGYLVSVRHYGPIWNLGRAGETGQLMN